MNRVGDSHYFNRNFSEAERYYGQAATANPPILLIMLHISVLL